MTSVSVPRAPRTNRPDAATGVHFVPLLRLPENVQFPDLLHDRIWFDDQRKCLAFRGFMSKATYDRLDALTNDDAYQQALDELFRQCIYEEPAARPRSLRDALPMAVLVMLALLTASLSIPLRLFVLREGKREPRKWRRRTFRFGVLCFLGWKI